MVTQRPWRFKRRRAAWLLHTSAAVSHVHTPEWQSFELRMRERARAHRRARRKRQIRRITAWTAGVLLAAGAGVAARSAGPTLRPAALLEAGSDYLDAWLRAGAAYAGAAAAQIDAGAASLAAAGARAGDGILRAEEYLVDLYAGARRAPAPAVRRPGQPFTPRGIVAPPWPAALLQTGDARLLAPGAPAMPAAADVPPPRQAERAERRTPAPAPVRARPEPPPARTDVSAAPAARTAVEPPPAAARSLEPPAAAPAPSVVSMPPAATAVASEPRPDNVAATGGTAVRSVDHRPAIQGVIERYRVAYESLDASAARQVWPGVEEAALARAFNSLASQRLMFDDCSISVADSSALATCRGTARVVPRVGGGSEATRRSWTFWLRQTGDRWFIERTQVR